MEELQAIIEGDYEVKVPASVEWGLSLQRWHVTT